MPRLKCDVAPADWQWMTAVIDHFLAFDKDRSGAISKDEFPALYASLKTRYKDLPEMSHFLANLDVDNSGTVTLKVTPSLLYPDLSAVSVQFLVVTH